MRDYFQRAVQSPMSVSENRLKPDVLHAYLSDLLTRSDALMSAGQCHGVLTGIACLGADTAPDWRYALLGDSEAGDVLARECMDFVQILGEQVAAQLAGAEFTFQPALPGDDAPIDERLRELGAWCEGFLFGIGIGGLPEAQALEQGISEFIHDVTEIAHVDATEELEGDADFQVFELIEYLRAGVTLMYDEWHCEPPANGATKH